MREYDGFATAANAETRSRLGRLPSRSISPVCPSVHERASILPTLAVYLRDTTPATPDPPSNDPRCARLRATRRDLSLEGGQNTCRRR